MILTLSISSDGTTDTLFSLTMTLINVIANVWKIRECRAIKDDFKAICRTLTLDSRVTRCPCVLLIRRQTALLKNNSYEGEAQKLNSPS